MDQISIGKFIAQKRKEQNLTQEQLAERLGVSNKTISKWETAKCMPDYTVITKLCEELNITISELMDGEESDGKSVRVYDDEQILDLPHPIIFSLLRPHKKHLLTQNPRAAKTVRGFCQSSSLTPV